MAEANPLLLVESLRRVLYRYIPTTLPVSRNYPLLRRKFLDLLRGQTLVAGPYVEALPDFEKGKTLRKLLSANGGYLHDDLANIPSLDRPLHVHQETALQLACREKKSLLVATGTGSGKTETFLYPIANALLNDQASNKPGVRCLIVYPMNALANDQLFFRIAPLFGVHLEKAKITFGRFTGLIKANTRRSEEEAKLLRNEKLRRALGGTEKIPSNWLLTREEMLETPPKILVTNYAMLEHLLLLPRNTSLFKDCRLHTVVLDEIHTYAGAQATEVAFLLRKLKTRLDIDRPIQVFGTSASLAEGEGADEALKVFASGLFGERVDAVVRGKRITHAKLTGLCENQFSLDISSWEKLGKILEEYGTSCDAIAWNAMVSDSGVRPDILTVDESRQFGEELENIFSKNNEIRRLATLLDGGGVQFFTSLADTIFNNDASATSDGRHAALSAMIHVGMLARATEDQFPLLPARYHIAVNSIEGLAVRLGPHGEGWEDVVVARHHESSAGLYFPLMVCRRCGQPFAEGYEEAGHLYTSRRMLDQGQGDRRVFWIGHPPRNNIDDEVDEEASKSKEDTYLQLRVNPITGVLNESGDDSITVFQIQTEEDPDEKIWYVKRCPACGGRASGPEAEIVTRMHPGNDALCSVVVQKVLEALPPGLVDNSDPRPLQGRNLLTFSDNRQDAAFFAPYFERTSADIALRAAIYKVLKKAGEPVDLAYLAEKVLRHWKTNGGQPVVLNANGELEKNQQRMLDQVIGRIAAEFCTPGGRRNSLEALGLVHITYDAEKFKRLRARVESFCPIALKESANGVEHLLLILLESIRREKALSKLYDIDLSDPFIWGEIYAGHRSFEIQALNPRVRNRWLPPFGQSRHNRRTWYLVNQLGWEYAEAVNFLQQVWDAMVHPAVRMLDAVNPGFGMDAGLIRLELADSREIYACKSCGLVQQYMVANKCIAFGCRGDAAALSPEERSWMSQNNHYVWTYQSSEPAAARAREHTAALATRTRELIEQEFAEKRVNLLSCTTTMEMGVDLGDLEAVVCLNAPPGPANYQQRTGRAGRRAQAAPFCVTVARNSQYDQAVFRGFHQYLVTPPPVPYLHLSNSELFQRHQNSVVLAHFLRYRIKDLKTNAPALEDLFAKEFGEQQYRAFLDDLGQWLEVEGGAKALEEAQRLLQCLPASLRYLGLVGKALAGNFASTMKQFATEVHQRWKQYTDRYDAAYQAHTLPQAQRWDRLRKQFLEQFLVNELSRRGLIPTYSFPVHSLSLEVTREREHQPVYGDGADISLNRNASLGISEYAPGAEVVANGRIWRSTALAQYPREFMPDRWYVPCQQCFHVDVADVREELPSACSNCGHNQNRRRRKFLEPKGFVTSYAERNGKDPGANRRRVRPADEARLIATAPDTSFSETDHAAVRTALLPSRPSEEQGNQGTMFIANRGLYGEGYYRCPRCNYSEAARGPNAQQVQHKDSLSGMDCPVTELKYPLDYAHIFNTDVRLLRFTRPLPPAPSDELNARHFHDRFARTLCEGLRFAASDFLQIQASEVRATYRLNGGGTPYVEVVLYDSVPGGAGYSARLGATGYPVGQLLAKAAARLDCSANCTGGCRQCLCDYSNQKNWDQFIRTPVLDWIRSLSIESNAGPDFDAHAVRWKQPSLKGMTERLANYPDIHIVGERLDALDGESSFVRDEVLQWLQAGKRVTIHLTADLQKGKSIFDAARLLASYRYLNPFVLDGRLNLSKLSGLGREDLMYCPRIFTGIEQDMPLWFTEYPLPPILETLLPEPAYEGRVTKAWSEKLKLVLAHSSVLPPNVLSEGRPVEFWELAPKQIRELSVYFGVTKGEYVDRLVIRDPYCGMGVRNRASLNQFVREIIGLAKTVKCVEVHCREPREKDANYEPAYELENRLKEQFSDLACELLLQVQSNRTSPRRFHDREVGIHVIGQDGQTLEHRYHLSGGIDYLMDINSESKVFRYVVGT